MAHLCGTHVAARVVPRLKGGGRVRTPGALKLLFILPIDTHSTSYIDVHAPDSTQTMGQPPQKAGMLVNDRCWLTDDGPMSATGLYISEC